MTGTLRLVKQISSPKREKNHFHALGTVCANAEEKPALPSDPAESVAGAGTSVGAGGV